MARHLENCRLAGTKFKRIAIGNPDVDPGNTRGIVICANHNTVPLRFQRFVTTGMVEMVMGIQNMRQLPAFSGQSGVNGLDRRCINDSGHIGRGVVDQKPVVVTETGEHVNF